MSKQRQTERQEIKLPEWVSRGGEQNFADAQAFVRNNPVQPYGGTLSASPDVNQYLAALRARENVGRQDLDAARGLVGESARGATPQVQTQRWDGNQAAAYMNPYLKAVQEAGLRELDRKAKIDQLDVNQAAQNARAFGGDRHGIMAAEAARNANMLRSDFLNQSNAAAYENAMRGFQTDEERVLRAALANQGAGAGDLQRMLQAGLGMANIGQTDAGINATQIANLTSTGGILQALRQAELDRLYEDWLRVQDTPLQRYSDLAGILGGTPTNRSSYGERVTSPGILQSILGALATGASAAGSLGLKLSERSMKKNIRQVGEIVPGLNIYSFLYKWQPDASEPLVGVMADEVAAVWPEALGPTIGEIRTVNYAELPPRGLWRFFED